jgi:hypothetical protein
VNEQGCDGGATVQDEAKPGGACVPASFEQTRDTGRVAASNIRKRSACNAASPPNCSPAGFPPISGARRTAKRNKTGPSFDVRFDCVSDVDIVYFLFFRYGHKR